MQLENGELVAIYLWLVLSSQKQNIAFTPIGCILHRTCDLIYGALWACQQLPIWLIFTLPSQQRNWPLINSLTLGALMFTVYRVQFSSLTVILPNDEDNDGHYTDDGIGPKIALCFSALALCCCCLLLLSLLSCVQLFCDPMDCSPPGSSVHRISQARITEMGCHFLLQRIFPTQGSNPHLMHWQTDSMTLRHPGSP